MNLSIYETSIEESISYLQKGRIQLSIILVMNSDIALFKQILPKELEVFPLFEDNVVATVSKHSIYANIPVIDEKIHLIFMLILQVPIIRILI